MFRLISWWIAAGLASAAILVIRPPVAQAQAGGRVQEIEGRIEPGARQVYRLARLRAGDTLYAYAQATSGNLDPIVSVLDADTDLVALDASYRAELEALLAGGQDIAGGLQELRDRTFLAWDDDSGGGYAAALQYRVPADGDYYLLVAGSLSALGRATSGEYRLLVGLNAPEVLSGEAQPTTDSLARFDQAATGVNRSVQAVTGALTEERPSISYNLVDLQPGDVLYAFVEATSGDLKPSLVLRDFGAKPVDAANPEGQDRWAALQHEFPDGGTNYQLQIIGTTPGGASTFGDYRLLVGVNAPEVLTGQATPTDNPALRMPIEVRMGFKLQQIVQIDQSQEFMYAVGSLRMEWSDPALAFSPDTCQCRFKVYTDNDFNRFLSDVQSRWPAFTFYNQQGNRWVQNRAAVINPDGSAVYFERFSANFQTDFDFRQFPFDVQPFPIIIDMIYPEDVYVLRELPGYSEISPAHGEDEFIISIDDFDIELSSQQGSTGNLTSRFTMRFEVPRYLNYYAFQIFIPIGLIILISWVTFFMKDFVKRAEVAAANVLLFIAFSFSLSTNYPRLGYMTFLDAIMSTTFIINALVVVYNVYLKWLENRGQSDRAERIDRYLDWLYPVAYIVAFGIAVAIFF